MREISELNSNTATVNKEESTRIRNWTEFFLNHPHNFKIAEVKGKLFDEINTYQGKIFCFPVKEGCIVKEDDLLLLNRYCEAYEVDDDSVTEDERMYSELVGTAQCVLPLANGTSVVFVRNCAVFQFENTSDPEYKITEQDICNACYLEDSATVTRDDSEDPFAGQIMSVEGNIVNVYVSLEWRD